MAEKGNDEFAEMGNENPRYMYVISAEYLTRTNWVNVSKRLFRFLMIVRDVSLSVVTRQPVPQRRHQHLLVNALGLVGRGSCAAAVAHWLEDAKSAMSGAQRFLITPPGFVCLASLPVLGP
jgi:hypothetical protein